MFQHPDWKLPNNINALFTDREGGVSQTPYSSFNLATHVDDDLVAVQKNRELLKSHANLPCEPLWLNQQHTDIVVNAQQVKASNLPPIADASWTQQAGQVIAVMTADCMPILLTTLQGDKVATIHAGWRGLQQGIISKTINQMQVKPKDISAWIGPAISQANFEVGEEVRAAFTKINKSYAQAFIFSTLLTAKKEPMKFLADLPAIAEMELRVLGVEQITQSGLCTFADEQQFYSYRRDGQTGRMAALIWID